MRFGGLEQSDRHVFNVFYHPKVEVVEQSWSMPFVPGRKAPGFVIERRNGHTPLSRLLQVVLVE